MPLMRKLAALGVAAEAARRYARNNPEHARRLTDKVAAFADQRTRGRYHGQIESAKRMLADLGGFADQGALAQDPPVRADAVITGTTDPTGTPRPTPYKRS